MLRVFRLLAILAMSSGCSSSARISYEDSVGKETAAARLTRAAAAIERVELLMAHDLSSRVRRLAAQPSFVTTLQASDAGERALQARLGFQRFLAEETSGAFKPDVMALVDANGDVVAMLDVPTVVAKQWRAAEPNHKTVFPALDAVLAGQAVVSDVTSRGNSAMRIGAASVIDAGAVIGAVVLIYPMTAREAQQEGVLAGAEIVYFAGDRVVASSFTQPIKEDDFFNDPVEDTARGQAFARWRAQGGSSFAAGSATDVRYLIAAVVPRAIGSLPPGYPTSRASVAVAVPISKTPEDDKRLRDPKAVLRRAHGLVQRTNTLEAIDSMAEAERLAAAPELASAIKAGSAERAKPVLDGVTGKPDLVAVFGATGDLIAGSAVPKTLPSIIAALGEPMAISDTWLRDDKTLFRIGVAAVVERSAAEPFVIGAVVIGRAYTTAKAQSERSLLGAEIAYHDGRRALIASKGSLDQISKPLASGELSVSSMKPLAVDGIDYLAAPSVTFSPQATKRLAPGYARTTAGVVVFAAVEH